MIIKRVKVLRECLDFIIIEDLYRVWTQSRWPASHFFRDMITTNKGIIEAPTLEKIKREYDAKRAFNMLFYRF